MKKVKSEKGERAISTLKLSFVCLVIKAENVTEEKEEGCSYDEVVNYYKMPVSKWPFPKYIS